MQTQTVIIGANSAIAKALSEQILLQSNTLLTLVSRGEQFSTSNKAYSPSSRAISIAQYDEENIMLAITEIQKNPNPISQVFICNGVLHNEHIKPERRLEDFSVESFEYILNANTLVPLLWLKHLLPLLSNNQSPCKISVLSARVGSITDNALGGWYSYRASKSALNMLLKTASIEFNRRAKHVKLISFHPGTTDSPLSKPFQKNVVPEKLFTPAFVAKQLLDITDNTEVDGTLSYIDWQGKHIDW